MNPTSRRAMSTQLHRRGRVLGFGTCQVVHRVRLQHTQGIRLLRDLHGAQLCSDGAAHPARHDDRRDDRCQLATGQTTTHQRRPQAHPPRRPTPRRQVSARDWPKKQATALPGSPRYTGLGYENPLDSTRIIPGSTINQQKAMPGINVGDEVHRYSRTTCITVVVNKS